LEVGKGRLQINVAAIHTDNSADQPSVPHSQLDGDVAAIGMTNHDDTVVGINDFKLPKSLDDVGKIACILRQFIATAAAGGIAIAMPAKIN
jgi:hypothetical protein